LKANNNVHISAPHIYCTVVDSLELEPNSALSFLNIGVGTGYLSCIVAYILGNKSQCYGVDIHSDVIQHCDDAINSWKDSLEDEHAQFTNFHGNGLNILDRGESSLGYDRIYVGAAIEGQDLESLKDLLGEGGILVAPVDDCLTKVVRMNNEITAHTITGVHFAPLLKTPETSVVIPAMKWDPSNHHLYPNTFQSSARALLLCSNSPYDQHGRFDTPIARTNLASNLPNHVWLHIISFTNRKWFDPKFCEVESLKGRLRNEKARVAGLQSENQILRGSYALLEHDRDLYSGLIRRMRTELRGALDQRESHDDGSYDPLYRTTQILLSETNAILNNYYNTRSTQMFEVDAEDTGMEVDDDEETSTTWEVDADLSMSNDAQTGGNEFNRSVRSHRTVSISTDDL